MNAKDEAKHYIDVLGIEGAKKEARENLSNSSNPITSGHHNRVIDFILEEERNKLLEENESLKEQLRLTTLDKETCGKNLTNQYNENENLKMDLGLCRIALQQEETLRLSCELSLSNRNDDVDNLTAANKELLEFIKRAMALSESAKKHISPAFFVHGRLLLNKHK